MAKKDDNHIECDHDNDILKFWKLYVLILGLLGILLFIVTNSYSIFDNPPVVKVFLSEFGIALLITAIVALFLESIIHRYHIQKILKAIKPIEEISLLNGASEVGLRDIFSRRQEGSGSMRGKKHIYAAFKEQLESKKGEIRIAGIAGLDIFQQRADDPENNFSSLIKKQCNHTDVNCTIRVLLLNPESEAARYKQRLEAPHKTIFDISHTIDILKDPKNEFKGKVLFKIYDTMPIALIYLTEKWLFIEPYPNLEVSGEKVPIGGYSPMMMFSFDSLAYQRWSGHFEELWKHAKNAP